MIGFSISVFGRSDCSIAHPGRVGQERKLCRLRRGYNHSSGRIERAAHRREQPQDPVDTHHECMPIIGHLRFAQEADEGSMVFKNIVPRASERDLVGILSESEFCLHGKLDYFVPNVSETFLGGLSAEKDSFILPDHVEVLHKGQKSRQVITATSWILFLAAVVGIHPAFRQRWSNWSSHCHLILIAGISVA